MLHGTKHCQGMGANDKDSKLLRQGVVHALISYNYANHWSNPHSTGVVSKYPMHAVLIKAEIRGRGGVGHSGGGHRAQHGHVR